jgi:hypothetical protein
MTIKRRGSNNYLRAYLNGTSLVYEYNGQNGTTVLETKTVNANADFSVGFDFNALATKYSYLFNFLKNQSDLEVLVGGGTTDSFAGLVYHVSFYSSWHNKVSSNTFTDGIVDLMTAGSNIATNATYSLIAVTEYGNFTLDVASSGYWQETIPLAMLTKEVEDAVGNKSQRVDFVQVNLGKTKPRLPLDEMVTMTYEQLRLKYWAQTYQQLSDYYDSYNDLSLLSAPSYDYSSLDIESWVTLHKITVPPTDYLQKSAMIYDGHSNVFLDDNNYRHLLQDGNSLVIPYNYDHTEYALTFYHIVKSRGQRSSPAKLKSFELASWASDATKVNPVGTQEGNNAYPYSHNGSFFVLDFPNLFEVTKRGYNYLYKSNRSGFKPKSLPMLGYDNGLAVRWKREGSIEQQQVAAVSFWTLLDTDTLNDSIRISTVTSGADEVVYIEAVPIEDGSRFALQAKYQGDPYINVQWFINGHMTVAPVFRAGEWNAVTMAFINPFDSHAQDVYVRMSGNTNFSFDHITIHGRLDAKVSGLVDYRRWGDLLVPTAPDDQWQAWGAYTWFSIYSIGAQLTVDILNEDMFNELTGYYDNEPFVSTVSANFNEIYTLRDIEWAPVTVITN